MFPIGFLPKRYNNYKKGKAQKAQIKKDFYPLLGILAGIGIGASLKMKKKRQKNCGSNNR